MHAAQKSGEQRIAYDYADRLRSHYDRYPDAPDYPGAALGWHIWRTVRLRFGDYESVLQDDDNNMPRETWRYAMLLGYYTKGVAYLMGTVKNIDAAKESLQAIQETLASIDESLKGVATIANLTLASVIQFLDDNGNPETALGLVQTAQIEQESWLYTEPPAWHMTVAQCEATLLHHMFRHDLKNIPENRQSLYGLWKALVSAEASSTDVANAKKRYEEASKWADDLSIPPIVCPQLGE